MIGETLMIFFLSLVISTGLIYIISGLFGEKEGFAEALCSGLVGTVIFAIAFNFIGVSIISTIIGAVAWLLSLGAFYQKMGLLKAFVISVIVWVGITVTMLIFSTMIIQSDQHSLSVQTQQQAEHIPDGYQKQCIEYRNVTRNEFRGRYNLIIPKNLTDFNSLKQSYVHPCRFFTDSDPGMYVYSIDYEENIVEYKNIKNETAGKIIVTTSFPLIMQFDAYIEKHGSRYIEECEKQVIETINYTECVKEVLVKNESQ